MGPVVTEISARALLEAIFPPMVASALALADMVLHRLLVDLADLSNLFAPRWKYIGCV